MRDEFKSNITLALSRRCGNRCSNPDCKKITSGPNEEDEKATIVGVAAHITAASKGGPRFNPTLTPGQRSHISNGIWLCSNCAMLIDKDPKKFDTGLLFQWKKQAEEYAAIELASSNPNQRKTDRATETPQSQIDHRTNFYQNLTWNQERNNYIDQAESGNDARNEIIKIIARLKTIRAESEVPTSGFILGFIQIENQMYGFGYNEFFLRFYWKTAWARTAKEGILEVSFLTINGHHGIDYCEREITSKKYMFDKDKNGNKGWSLKNNSDEFYDTEELISTWLNLFFKELQKRQKQKP